ISGPIIGFATDSGGTVIRPLIGVPGAAVLADQLKLEADIRNAVISPSQDYAIAVRSDDGNVVLVTLTANPQVTPIVKAYRNPSVVGISPVGSSAAIYDAVGRRIQVIGHLPGAAEIIYDFDLSAAAGRATAMVVSDDGTIALLTFVDDD